MEQGADENDEGQVVERDTHGKSQRFEEDGGVVGTHKLVLQKRER